jgi:hypothetical protein
MIYSEVRNQIKSGDILAWTHKPLSSWYDFKLHLIRIFTKSEYTHVGIAVVLNKRVFVLESTAQGIRLKLLSEDLPFYWMPTKYKYWNDELETEAFKKIGGKYSNWEGVRSLWEKITPGDNEEWECAEFVHWIFNKAGFKLDIKNTPAEVVWWAQSVLKLPLYLVTKE